MFTRRFAYLIPILVAGCLSVPAVADEADTFLSVDRIFQGNELQEERLGTWVWSRRGEAYWTLEAPAEGDGRELVRWDAASGRRELVLPAQAFRPAGHERPLTIEGLEFSADENTILLYTNSRRVWRRNTRGDYWVLEVATRRLRQLGGNAPPSSLMFAKLSPDGRRVAYVHEHNLYVQDLDDGFRITQLTSDGSATCINGTSDWVNEEELDIRDAYRWSPDGRSLAFWQFDTTGVGTFYLLDNTSGLYSRPIAFAYPKVGERNSSTRLGVVSSAGGAVQWLDIPGDPREHYLPHLEWTPTGDHLLVQQLNRLQNANRVMLADPRTGAARLVLTETDDAWLENDNPVRWLAEGREFLWISERDGWRQAYRAATNGESLARVTQGEFDVIDVEFVDQARGWLYFAASPENPTHRYLYRTPLTGGPPERLTPPDTPGWHTYDIAPSGNWALHTYSTLLTPPVVDLIRLPDHHAVRTLVTNAPLRDKLSKMPLPTAEFLRIDVGDDLLLDAWCLLPPGVAREPAADEAKHPLLFYVYGEPYGQTVRDAWTGQRGLWHLMLAQRGVVVASVDNRGTRVPRGRAWRKSVYRQIGILAPQDQAAATRALLARWPFVDPQRVGIWGWSGGGSMSLNAIFRYPELYQVAIAVAPNANQLLYDTIYQERYMGLPADNAENYRLGSPLTHAHRLQGELLLVHGTGDDNGHYQGTEMLINELIAHHKNFSVMPYPGRSHAISEGRNTTRHFYALLTRFLREHLIDNGEARAEPPSRLSTQ